MAAATLMSMSMVVALASPPSTDLTKTDMVNGTVRALAQVGNDIWIGGAFTEVLDQSQNPLQAAGGLAAFDASGQLDTSIQLPIFTSTTGTATVYGLSLGPDGNLYVAGTFNAVNGKLRDGAAAIDPSTGALLAFAPKAGDAKSILATSSGIFVGTSRLLSFQPSGSPTPGYSPPTAHTDPTLRGHITLPAFRGLAISGNTVVAACQCDSMDDANGSGNQTKAIVEIDANSGDLLGWSPANLAPSSAAFGISVIIHDAPNTTTPTIYLAAGGNDFSVAYDLSTGKQLWKEDTSGSSQGITWFQNDLIVGGHFDWTAKVPTTVQCGDNTGPNTTDCYLSPHLVAMDPATGQIILVNGVPWNPGICCAYNAVWVVLADMNGTTLHVGGEFTRAGTATWTYDTSTHSYSMAGGAKQDYYARFDAPAMPQALDVKTIGGGTGTVKSSPAGIACPTTCSSSFAGNSTVNLTATANVGSSFAGWSGDCTGTITCTLAMNTSHSVTATFATTCGKVLFSSTRAGAGDIFVMNPDGTGPTDLTNNAAVDTSPAWSPNCHQIAFSSTRGAGSSHIFVMNADGGGVLQVTTGSGNDSQPKWAPGGLRLAFVSDRAGNRELYTIGVGGTGLVRLTNNSWADVQPDWSPKGNRIVFASNRFGPMDLFTILSNGSHRTRITQGPRPFTQPEWSPSASRIVLVSGASGSPQVWVMNADGSGLTRLTNDGKTDSHPTWAPLGARIAYSSTRSGNPDIWVMSANGSGALNVTKNPAQDTAPSWR